MSKSSQIRLVLFLLWCAVLLVVSDDVLSLITGYGAFLFLGILGAVFANSTGAGGGVVFVPFFSELGFDNTKIVATSFAIQCFGMTAGAISWYVFRRHQKSGDSEWAPLGPLLWLSIPFSICGIWLVQYLELQSPNSLHAMFGGFSIVLALAIFASIPLLKRSKFQSEVNQYDRIFLPVVAIVGGAITAWLSVGVGELVAIYLIFRGFNVSFAIAVAVILSAFSVWAGIMYHLVISNGVYWPVIAFAGLGAVIGGSVARYLVLYFSVTKLKIIFASWVFLLGLAALPG